jgi:DNA modification methylase
MDRFLNKITCGDNCDLLGLLPSECIDLVVTSPPYFNAREYAQWPTYADYLETCNGWIGECLRVLKPGRMLCVNSSSVIEARANRGSRSMRYNIPADLYGICKNHGAWFVEELIWEKPEGSALNRSQRFSVDRHPMQWRANATTERVLVCQKPTDCLNDEIIKNHDTGHRVVGEFDRGEVWRINPASDPQHPAVFPVELPSKLIRYYSWPREIVLDPFSGSGTTAKAAKELERQYIGFEINPAYCNIGEATTAQEVLSFATV